MKPYRNLKMGSLIQKELGEMIIREFDFDGALPTIMGVDVSSDLSEARVKLAILPYEKGPEVFIKIEKRRRELEYKLVRKLNIRPLPHLKFEIAKE